MLESNQLSLSSLMITQCDFPFHPSAIFGGEIEIRTLAGLAPPNGFQDHPLQPLGYFSTMVHLSGFEPASSDYKSLALTVELQGQVMVRDVGFEPTRAQHPRDFKSLASTISPIPHFRAMFLFIAHIYYTINFFNFNIFYKIF